jgi:hypothetical protein
MWSLCRIRGLDLDSDGWSSIRACWRRKPLLELLLLRLRKSRAWFLLSRSLLLVGRCLSVLTAEFLSSGSLGRAAGVGRARGA